MRKFSALFLVLLVATICFLPITAYAESIYDQSVYDGANLLSSDELEKVQTATTELADFVGADVHVVIVDSIGSSPSLDSFIDDIVDDTPSWQSPTGDVKASLLVFAMSLDSRDMGIYFGETWKPAFAKDSEMRLMNDYMVPEFKSGDYATGFIKAMEEAGRVLDNHLHPTTQSPVAQQPQTAKETNPAVIAVLLSLLVIGALAVLVFFLIKFLRKMRAENEAREVARQEALRLRDATTSALNDYRNPTTLKVIEAKVAKYSKLDSASAEKLQGYLSSFKASYDSAVNQLNDASSASATAEDKNLAIGIYEALSERYAESLRSAKSANQAVSSINSLTELIQQVIDSIDNEFMETEKTFTNVSEQLGKFALLPITVSTEQNKYNVEKTAFDSLKTQSDRTVATSRALKKHQANLEKISEELTNIMALYDDFQKLRPSMPGKISATEKLIETIKPIFDELEANYAEKSWESIAGNGSRATALVAQAKDLLATADKTFASTEIQNAHAELQAVSILIEDSTELLNAISSRRDSLRKAMKRAPEEFRLAEIDIEKAKKYVSAHSEDVDVKTHQASIQDAENDLAQAKAEFAKPLPNPDIVIAKALEANHDADRILELCMNEHDQAERQRHQAKEALAKLQSDLDQADRYVRNNSSDLSSSEKSALDSARSAYEQARRATDVATIIMLASTAQRKTNDAYSRAQRTVRDAEEARDRAERARQRQLQQQRSSSSSSYNSSSSFGGSSRSFSSGSSLGGSSRKW